MAGIVDKARGALPLTLEHRRKARPPKETRCRVVGRRIPRRESAQRRMMCAVVCRNPRLLLIVAGIWLFSACSPRAPVDVAVQTEAIPGPTETSQTTARDAPVNVIELAGPVAARDSEISGLAWYGGHLIILPQYPHRVSTGGDGVVFALSKAEIIAYLDGAISGPLEASEIPFLAPGLKEEIEGFEGFEAITFVGDRVFVTVEAKTARGMRGYLVPGTISIGPDRTALTLDANLMAEIQPQSGINNLSEESLITAGESLITIYEANGAEVNPSPVAHRFSLGIEPMGTVAFPNVEYRITDATALDIENRFWGLNISLSTDLALLPKTDPLAEQFGEGVTRGQYMRVERLVQFQYTESGIKLTGAAPIQLELLPGSLPRNWEGLVRLDSRGFLLMTDGFPDTILGFVPLPDGR